MSNTYWAIKRRERAAAAASAEPIVIEPEPVETPTAETATKAELIAAAEQAGIEVKAGDTKADIAAKLADGAEG